MHCICGILVAPIPYTVCMCHRCDSSCFQIPHCRGHVSWGQCRPVSVRAECLVCLCHLGILLVLHGLDKDIIAINFHHNYDVLVSLERSDGELAGLVGEHGLAYHVCLGVHIAHFFSHGGVRCRIFPAALPLFWWTIHFFLFGLDAPLQF
jgi:hypothetical protein